MTERCSELSRERDSEQFDDRETYCRRVETYESILNRIIGGHHWSDSVFRDLSLGLKPAFQSRIAPAQLMIAFTPI